MHAFDYSFDLEGYITKERFARLKEFASDKETPFVVLSRDVVGRKYDGLRRSMPYADIYYAIKANPDAAILELLIEKGNCFDIASVYELDWMLKLGASPERLSYGNTIKKARDIRYAYDRGVRRSSDLDRKNTRLNSSHRYISYAVFCLKKKKTN